MSNVDNDKPRYIECVYEATIEFDLEELEIDWERVEDYWIKYGELTIKFKDGETKSYQGNDGEVDYKWAVKENIMTEDWEFVEGLN